ncbi:hypothetical protein DEMA109039_22395 [Deinococcus marmoris]
MIQGHPHERNRKAMDYRTQDQEVEGSVPVFPGGAVHTHQDLARGKVNQEQGQKHLCGELFIVDGAFHAPLLGFRGTGPG